MRLHKLFASICLTLCCLLIPGMKSQAQQEGNAVHQIGLQDYVETVYDESNGMSTSEANVVMQDSVGYIWVGSYGGLSRFNGVEFEDISRTRAGAPASGVRCMLEDSLGRIWIGTNDSGISMMIMAFSILSKWRKAIWRRQ